MSALISLKPNVSRRVNAFWYFVLYGLMIVGLISVLGLIGSVSSVSAAQSPVLGAGSAYEPEYADDPVAAAESSVGGDSELSPRMRGALTYVAQRYKVSVDAVRPVLEAAQLIGQERSIDPLLIVAIIGVESRFNPFAESSMGAKGLMQIIPRFHRDKIPNGIDPRAFLDPVTNIRVGALVLQEAIERRGGVAAGLQYYAGSSDSERLYANKVLAERARLEKAAQRSAG